MKKYTQYLAVAVPVLGFIFTLFVATGFQYFRMNNDLAGGIVKKLQQAEARELSSFFSSINNQLMLLREWGQQDLLFTADATSFNRKMIPLLKQLSVVQGIIIAEQGGREYYLYRDNDSYIARTTEPEGIKSQHSFSRWSENGQEIESWQDSSDYRPASRPWFIGAQKLEQDNRVFWTRVYTFFHSGQPGITGAVGWTNKNGQFVVGMDIPLENISRVLEKAMDGRVGQLYLINETSGQYLLAGKSAADLETAYADRERANKLAQSWIAAGRPKDELVAIGRGKGRWLGIFHQMTAEHGGLWLVLAAPEAELIQGIANLHVGSFELLVGLLGGLGTFFLWRFIAIFSAKKKRKSPEIRLADYLLTGEGNRVEFKSTVRMNLKSGKQGKEIELAWLKAVVAFLNSEGGVLLLGIGDDSEVLGLEPDGFENEDRCLLHIKNLINQHIGPEFSAQIELVSVAADGKMVVMIECRKADRPVFLRIGKNEEFYVRSGPSSMKLSPSQTVNYVCTSEVSE